MHFNKHDPVHANLVTTEHHWGVAVSNESRRPIRDVAARIRFRDTSLREPD